MTKAVVSKKYDLEPSEYKERKSRLTGSSSNYDSPRNHHGESWKIDLSALTLSALPHLRRCGFGIGLPDSRRQRRGRRCCIWVMYNPQRTDRGVFRCPPIIWEKLRRKEGRKERKNRQVNSLYRSETLTARIFSVVDYRNVLARNSRIITEKCSARAHSARTSMQHAIDRKAIRSGLSVALFITLPGSLLREDPPARLPMESLQRLRAIIVLPSKKYPTDSLRTKLGIDLQTCEHSAFLFEGAFLPLESEDKPIEGRISRPAVRKGMTYIRSVCKGAGVRQQVGARSDTFWRKTYGVAKEEGTFLEKSRKLDPSRIFFMASHGVSAHSASWMLERLIALVNMSSPYVPFGPHCRFIRPQTAQSAVTEWPCGRFVSSMIRYSRTPSRDGWLRRKMS
ncbi:hypothetical protein DBV15_10265 [Temnothorax longispinosus]|uniref:Uncharacterized protein n=1 Tax=Temnothorax longispinosus TaxID=300112 RepID=A0A4S2KR67_9HYME|nr:hypothetical protein DBV15_10265 [Temnothorax longispinosus]